MKPKHILMLEDDPLQGSRIRECLAQAGNNGCEVIWLLTEKDFQDHLKKIKAGAPMPDLVVSDMLLPWAFAGEFTDETVPPEVKRGTFRRAGTRCYELFRREFGTPENPQTGTAWIYFTVLEAEDIEFDLHRDARTRHVPKREGTDQVRKVIEELP